jgi:PRC-barrel domain
MPDDDGYAVHYTALERGTPVYSSENQQVGTVAEVWDNRREHIFDGLVIDGSDGKRRFVDAPEVARTAERAVRLNITAAEVAALGAPQSGGPGSALGGLSKLFKRRG